MYLDICRCTQTFIQTTLLLTLLSFFKVGCKEIHLNEDCIFLEAFMTLLSEKNKIPYLKCRLHFEKIFLE